MAKVIAMSNHKGGVGKTTSALNIGAGIANLGKKVLLIDLDPQANLSQSLNIREPEKSVYGVLRNLYNISEAILSAEGGYKVVPSELDLSGAEVELSSEAGREFILKEQIDSIRSQFDYIIIDCPPSLGLLTINGLTAADEVYLPLQAEFLAMQGLSKLIEVITKIKARLNRKLEIGGVFVTQYDHRKVLNRNVYETIERHFGDKVYKTKIRENIALAEAPSTGKDIFHYNPRSFGAEDYSLLCHEILQRNG
jgi:chromosome partitioning protein